MESLPLCGRVIAVSCGMLEGAPQSAKYFVAICMITKGRENFPAFFVRRTGSAAWRCKVSIPTPLPTRFIAAH